MKESIFTNNSVFKFSLIFQQVGMETDAERFVEKKRETVKGKRERINEKG